MTDLSIVIVNWNGGPLLLRCLDSIRASRHAGRLNVLVVDNHSSDGSRETATAAFPEFRVIDSGGNLGFGRANNLARGLTADPLVLFLNPDTEVSPDALERASQCLDRHPDVGALGCRMLYPDGSVQALGLQWHTTPWTVLVELLLISSRTRRFLGRWLPTVDPNRSGYVQKLYGGFLMVRRNVLDTAGWFDERYFMYAEDADLSRTILSLGWKLYYCAESEIVHVTGGTTAGAPSAFSTLMKQESVNKFIAKYQGRSAAVLHRAAVLLGGLFRLAIGVPLRLAAGWRKDARQKARLEASRFNHRQLVLWALGLKRAATPAAAPADRTAVA